METALAISYALGDVPTRLIEVAKKGGLNTRKLLRQVRLRFEEPPSVSGTRVMGFFREFFHYSYALEVFKDKPARGYYLPRLLVQDLEHLIQFIVEKDRQVLRELLTTDHYFVDIEYDQDEVAFQPSYFQPSNGNNPVRSGPSTPRCTGFPRWVWTNQQPVKIPSGQRAGILTHPAWLAAWSGN